MTLRSIFIAAAVSLLVVLPSAAKDKNYKVVSPDGNLSATLVVGQTISYAVSRGDVLLIDSSEISMTMTDGSVFGKNDNVCKVRKVRVDQTLSAVAYKRAEVRDNYNEITLIFKEFSLVFRAYDEGIAYRFVNGPDDAFVQKEQAEFRFANDWTAFVPYVSQHTETLDSQYWNSFESTYDVHCVSEWDKKRMAFLPLAVAADNGIKVLITEADLLDYPGMYLYNEKGSTCLSGRFARYPETVRTAGLSGIQEEVIDRKDFIAKASAGEAFPWRVIMVTKKDSEMAVNDLVWKLATPSDPSMDFSWVKPGMAVWDWWHGRNLYGVDFRPGINTETYKYYIDFASCNGVPYVLMDAGWSPDRGQQDQMKVLPEINLPFLIEYARERNVGLILWVGFSPFRRNMEAVCRHFSRMGIKGFKVDFMDRDDQDVVDFHRKAAKTTARYGLMIDFHGTYKPVGLNRTYPNVVNYEGVFGLEQMKWKKATVDQVTYDVTMPFIRMAAGPVDYTQGAMRNASKGNYHPVESEPMSQGTRCHQLAEYVVFDSPLNMMCDSPSNYMAEPECTKFIAGCPTVWDESLAVNGEIGQFITLARRSGNVWYVGSLNNWNARDLTLNLGFLGEGEWTMEIFRDGVNADRAARDFKRESYPVPADRNVRIHMAPGGGWAARLTRK